MALRRIAIMTSGGDSPGMNAALRAAVRAGVANGLEMYGVRNGFDGLLKGSYQPLGSRDVSGILGQGGTMLHTARCPEFLQPAGQQQASGHLKEDGIDGIIVIGGDGSMRGASALHELNFPVVGIPASIDNDVWGTNMSIGVDTALNTIVRALDAIRDTASSHRRTFLVETMGRDCGYLALMGGLVGGAELVMIPEIETDPHEAAHAVEEAHQIGKSHVIVVIAEGAKYKTIEVASYLEEHAPLFEVRITILGHVQRGGRPSAFDRLMATRMGVKAIELLMAGDSGVMIGLHGREMGKLALQEVCAHQRQVNLDYFEMSKLLS